jgi:hypothetical protein
MMMASVCLCGIDNFLVIAAIYAAMYWFPSTACGAEFLVKIVLGRDFRVHSDVIIGVFAHLCVVDTKDLVLFVSAKSETWDEMHGPKNDCLRLHHKNVVLAVAGRKHTVTTKE